MWHYHVQCVNCGIRTPSKFGIDAAERCMALWNNRADEIDLAVMGVQRPPSVLEFRCNK